MPSEIITTRDISDICRKAKTQQGKTYQDIADGTGLSLATVTSFFSRPSKAPSFYTVISIMAYLRIDANGVFGIEPQEAPQAGTYEKDIQIARLEGRIEQMELYTASLVRQMKQQRSASIILSIICAVLMAVVIGYISFDASIRNAGLIQNGNVSIYVVIIFAAMILALVVMFKLMTGIIRDFAPPPPVIHKDNPESE